MPVPLKLSFCHKRLRSALRSLLERPIESSVECEGSEDELLTGQRGAMQEDANSGLSCAVCQMLRIISFTVTQLPGPNYHCRGGEPTAVREMPEKWWGHVVVDIRRQVSLPSLQPAE